MSLKDKIDIVEVIQKYLNLQKRGKYYVALCPFHRETKPSFYVSPELQIFKCFGCGEGGDAIKFIMKMENIDYQTAVAKIAEWFGLHIEKETPKSEIKKFLEINYAALKFFRSHLTTEIKNYLHQRGVNDASIEKFEIGFSPGGTNLRDYLYAKGFSANDLLEVGLLDSRKQDRFQSRIIFPLRDENGRLVGFMGRIFPPNSEIGPKYLNTPDTKIFQKNRFLYGLVFTINSINVNKRVFVTEGNLDVILAQENGLLETVASSGTSLTVNHLRKLKKYTSKLIFAFDNDLAGLKSILRINPIAQKMGFETECLLYEDSKDLADWFLNHKINELQIKSTIDFLLSKIQEIYQLDDTSEKTKALEEILQQVKYLNPIKKEEALLKISQFFQVSKEFLINHLDNIEDIYLPEETETEITKITESNDDFLLFKYTILANKLGRKIEDPNINNDLIQRINNNQLTEEEQNLQEMLNQYYESSEIDLEKEFSYCQKIIQEKILKNKLKELEKWLQINPNESDKILKEIKSVSEKLKKIHAQER